MMKKCVICFASFNASGGHITCGPAHSVENKKRYLRRWYFAKKKRMTIPGWPPLTQCAVCKKKFRPRNSIHKTCSDGCSHELGVRRQKSYNAIPQIKKRKMLQRRKRYAENREKHRAYRRKYYLKNREKILLRQNGLYRAAMAAHRAILSAEQETAR